MTYNDLECQFYVKIRFRQQGCRALTFALARLSCSFIEEFWEALGKPGKHGE